MDATVGTVDGWHATEELLQSAISYCRCRIEILSNLIGHQDCSAYKELRAVPRLLR